MPGRCSDPAERVLEPLQESLDIIQFQFRTGLISGAPAEFVEDAAGALEVAFFRHTDPSVVIGKALIVAVAVQWIWLVFTSGLAARVRIRCGAAVGLLHLLHLLANRIGSLLQSLHRVALRAYRIARLLLAKGLAGILHRAFCLSQRVRDLTHPLGQLAHELAELAA